MGGRCSAPSAEQLKTVEIVIIGCGYGGLQLASDFKQAGVKFTIIEPKEYFHHCVGALRASVYSGSLSSSSLLFNKPLPLKFSSLYKYLN